MTRTLSDEIEALLERGWKFSDIVFELADRLASEAASARNHADSLREDAEEEDDEADEAEALAGATNGDEAAEQWSALSGSLSEIAALIAANGEEDVNGEIE